VTIGVVALNTAARQFDFVLQDARNTGRVLAMFPKAGKTLYREARAKLKRKLADIRNAVNGQMILSNESITRRANRLTISIL
jgi:hypothetical protein